MIDRELTDYLLVNACTAAVAASQRVMEIYSQKELSVSVKSDNTIVTKADTDSHNVIKAHLSKSRIPMLSEEGRNMLYQERYRWDLYWLVDPLDGSKEYVKHNDEFVVCIALMYENRPLIGVIAIPAEGKLYFSDPDRGSFCIDDYSRLSGELSITELYRNARELEPAINEESDTLRILVSRSHKSNLIDSIIEKQREIYSNVEVIECGSSLKFCRLAEAQADVLFKMTSMLDWDVAAGYAIIKGIGAKIAHISGEEILFNKENLTIEPHYASIKRVLL